MKDGYWLAKDLIWDKWTAVEVDEEEFEAMDICENELDKTWLRGQVKVNPDFVVKIVGDNVMPLVRKVV